MAGNAYGQQVQAGRCGPGLGGATHVVRRAYQRQIGVGCHELEFVFRRLQQAN